MAQMADVATTQSMTLIEAEYAERARLRQNRARIEAWRRIGQQAGDTGDTALRARALACIQTLALELRTWTPASDPACEVPEAPPQAAREP